MSRSCPRAPELTRTRFGLLDDVEYWTLRVPRELLSDRLYTRALYPLQINRGIALLRLRRLDEALAAFQCAYVVEAVWTESGPASAEAAANIIEIHIERSELRHAEALFNSPLFAAAAPEDRWGQLARRRAGALLRIGQGEIRGGLEELHAVVAEATSLAPDGGADDVAMEALHALEHGYRIAGQTDDARDVVRRIGARLRSNAERTLNALASEPGLSSSWRPRDGVVRDLDAHIASRAQAVGIGEHAVMATLQQLIALNSQASSAEDSTGEHGVRVAALAREVADALGAGQEVKRLTVIAALVHDVGKFGVPHSILTSEKLLTEDDQLLLDTHAATGAEMLERAAIPDRARLAEIVRLHHHPYDGIGAAQTLIGECIALEARILAACDRFDALVVGRPRRPALSVPEAQRELLKLAGRDLDPKVVASLIEVVRRLQAVHPDVMAYLAEDAEHYDFTAARRLFRRSSA